MFSVNVLKNNYIYVKLVLFKALFKLNAYMYTYVHMYFFFILLNNAFTIQCVYIRSCFIRAMQALKGAFFDTVFIQ